MEMNWNSEKLVTAFSEMLKNHPGYPSQDKTWDHTLHQDKKGSLDHLGPDMSIPCMYINFSTIMPETLSVSDLQALKCFFDRENEGHGLTIKLPFSTNSKHVAFCTTYEEAVSQIISYQIRFGANIPFAIIEPTLANKMEYKLAFTERGFSHFCKSHLRASPAFAFGEDRKLIAFANAVYEKLKLDPTFLNGPIIRIDIMCRQDPNSNSWGGLVCNEVESLEAMISALGRFGGATKDNVMHQSLEQFWKTYIGLTYDYVATMKAVANVGI